MLYSTIERHSISPQVHNWRHKRAKSLYSVKKMSKLIAFSCVTVIFFVSLSPKEETQDNTRENP